MRRAIGISLLFLLTASIAFLPFISAPEGFLIPLHAEFPEPVEFKGAEVLKGYPNALIHVAIFRFKESSRERESETSTRALRLLRIMS